MIHRPNYLDVQRFLRYHRDALQHDGGTVQRYWISLRALLTWTDSTPLPHAKTVRPTFPAYIVAAKSHWDPAKRLAPSHMARALSDSRAFFTWMRQEDARYADISLSWISSLRLPRALNAETELKPVQSWTLDEVLMVAALEAKTLAEQRDQAAVAFLYLSGMRVGAFSTLLIACVDLAERTVQQLPAKGVATKNHKAAITTLLPIPELLDVIGAWEAYVRARLPESCLWYPRIDRASMRISPAPIGSLSGRRNALVEGMQRLAARAAVPYRSPHKLRHGHALYGVQHARTMAELKAVSQNLMHSSITITDGI
jgi:site-specific recombinase XerD